MRKDRHVPAQLDCTWRPHMPIPMPPQSFGWDVILPGHSLHRLSLLNCHQCWTKCRLSIGPTLSFPGVFTFNISNVNFTSKISAPPEPVFNNMGQQMSDPLTGLGSNMYLYLQIQIQIQCICICIWSNFKPCICICICIWSTVFGVFDKYVFKYTFFLGCLLNTSLWNTNLHEYSL